MTKEGDGSLIPKRVVIIFPKRETYEFKSTDYKFYMREQIKKRLSYYVSNETLTLYCFVEDELAYTIIDNLTGGLKEINYLSCFNTMDRVIWGREVYGKEFKYPKLKSDSHLLDIINNVTKKTVAKQDAGVPGGDAYMQILNIRRRMVVTEFLSSPEYVVLYFDRKNQYCNINESSVGDTRVIHKVNLNEDNDSYCFSGQHIDEELFKRVIEEG